MNFAIYIADTETTGLDSHLNDIIELSILRLSDGEQKTWCLKPFNLDAIEMAALKINHHKFEDITHQTKFGKDTYLDPNKVIIEIENWVLSDNVSTKNRILCGQNIAFDKGFLDQLWKKCNSKDTMPFGYHMLDTMQIAFMLDMAESNLDSSYSLSSLIKKYGIKNDKAHSAEGDVKATSELFKSQLEYLKKKLSK